MLQPKRYGGYEFGMEDYLRLSATMGRGDPGVLGASGSAHTALSVCSHWPADVQDELFGEVNGDFIAPHRAPPAGSAKPVEGGYLINGEWRYSSGVPSSTHFIGATILASNKPGPPQVVTFTVPRSQFSIKPGSWGNNESLGLQASGSQTVVIEDQLVPAEMVFPLSLFDTPDTTPGLELHGNPIYLGRLGGYFHAGLVATQVGAAGAALDEYERLIREGPTRSFGVTFPQHRIEMPDYVRHYGNGLALRDHGRSDPRPLRTALRRALHAPRRRGTQVHDGGRRPHLDARAARRSARLRVRRAAVAHLGLERHRTAR